MGVGFVGDIDESNERFGKEAEIRCEKGERDKKIYISGVKINRREREKRSIGVRRSKKE